MQKLLKIYFIAVIISSSFAWADDPLQIKVIEPSGEENSLTLEQWQARQKTHCQELLNHIYRELTIKNLERSYKRLTSKLLLAYITLYEKAMNGHSKENISLIYLTKSLKNLDPEFEELIAKHRTAPFYQQLIKRFGTLPSTSNFNFMVQQWYNFQKSSPEFFKDLDKEYFLDEWDVTMSNVIDQVDTLAPNNQQLALLSRRFQKPDLIQPGGNLPSPNLLKNNIGIAQEEILKLVNQIYLDSTSEYKDYCDQDALDHYLSEQNQCSIKMDFTSPRANLVGQLNMLAHTANKADLPSIPEKPAFAKITDRSGFLDIEKPTYSTNKSATYCTRDMDIVDTIIIHHTATGQSVTPETINSTHIGRSTSGDQWYMIGYNYLISGAYPGKKDGEESAEEASTTVYQGRPETIIGAHAGGKTKSISEETKKIMKTSQISCGREGKKAESKNAVEFINKTTKQINGNYNSIGIAVIGNYAPIVYRKVGGVVIVKNEGGYRTGPKLSPRYPSDKVLQKLAQLMCDIQKRNPRVTIFKPHHFIRQTDCPGSIYDKFDKIKDLVKELGCEFSY